jgi:hypothetical protein
VTAEDGVELAGGQVVKVDLVVLEAADGDLPARRAEDERPNTPARHRQHETGAAELGRQVLPLPTAVLLGRIL